MKFILCCLISLNLWSSVPQSTKVSESLENKFMTSSKDILAIQRLKSAAMKEGPKAVPVLIKVMKDDKFPEHNRWQATFLLGKIMGKKSAPFIAKFASHPHWMMRVAALKSLLALKESSYLGVYEKALKDESLIVRFQALENINQLKITKLNSAVWAMLFDQTNYTGDKGKRKRTSLISKIIRTLGDLKFQKATNALTHLTQKPKYQDLLSDLNYSLHQLTGKSTNTQKPEEIRKFWSQQLISQKKVTL